MRELDRILKRWDKLLQEFPRKKRELLERLGTRLLGDVRAKIGGTGTVRGWQERYVGSIGGYVAVRPKADTYKVTKGGEQYAVGYVTNAIENGHKHRTPGQVKKAGYTYHPRIHTAAVPGRHFYHSVRNTINGLSTDALAELAAEVAAGLEGRG